jgi:hypothetical protein
MSSIENIFIQSKGQPVNYNGHLIQMVDYVQIERDKSIEITFESTNSEWRQGIHLSIDGAFLINGVTIKKSLVLWQDTAPSKVVLGIKSKTGKCTVKNVWDLGDGVMHSWHNGAAMRVEKSSEGSIYYCNDGHPDENFDDLIFHLRVVD